MVAHFPTVSGSNLERKRLALPKDFEGRVNVLYVAFQQRQQGEVNTEASQ